MAFLDDNGVTKLTSYLKTKIQVLINGKQDTLVSGTNIKTVNNNSLLGSGNVSISVPTASTTNPSMDGTASYGSGTTWARADHVHPTDTSRQATLVSGTNIKTINNESILGSGNISISGGGGLNKLILYAPSPTLTYRYDTVSSQRIYTVYSTSAGLYTDSAYTESFFEHCDYDCTTAYNTLKAADEVWVYFGRYLDKQSMVTHYTFDPTDDTLGICMMYGNLPCWIDIS